MFSQLLLEFPYLPILKPFKNIDDSHTLFCFPQPLHLHTTGPRGPPYHFFLLYFFLFSSSFVLVHRPPEDLWSFFDSFSESHVAAMAPCMYHYGSPRNKVNLLQSGSSQFSEPKWKYGCSQPGPFCQEIFNENKLHVGWAIFSSLGSLKC